MIRDRYDGDAMARLMSMIMAVFLLVPIVAPGVGAGLIAVLPWRAVFWFPAVVAGLLALWAVGCPKPCRWIVDDRSHGALSAKPAWKW